MLVVHFEDLRKKFFRKNIRLSLLTTEAQLTAAVLSSLGSSFSKPPNDRQSFFASSLLLLLRLSSSLE